MLVTSALKVEAGLHISLGHQFHLKNKLYQEPEVGGRLYILHIFMSCTEQLQGYWALVHLWSPLRTKKPMSSGSHPPTSAGGWQKKKKRNITNQEIKWRLWGNTKEYMKWSASVDIYMYSVCQSQWKMRFWKKKVFFPSQYEAEAEHSWEAPDPQNYSHQCTDFSLMASQEKWARGIQNDTPRKP